MNAPKKHLRLLRRVASAPGFVNPFVGKRGMWYRIDAKTMRAIRETLKQQAKRESK